MQAALAPFQEAYADGRAQPVAIFLSPVPPAHDPGRLYDFYRASNDDKIEGDVRYALKYNKKSRMSNKETDAWIDILVLYWRAVQQIILAEEAANQGKLGDGQFLAVYDKWKDLTNSFLKHISAGSLPPWAIFTLYFTANHFRRIAIKADEYLAKAKPVAAVNSFSDDVAVPQTANNKMLEEAARLFNRVFSLCLGDRCVCTSLYSCNASLTQAQKPRHVRVSQMGRLLYSQPSIQDVLQGTASSTSALPACTDVSLVVERHQLVEERGQGHRSPGRPAALPLVPTSTPRYVPILHWRIGVPGGGLSKGWSPKEYIKSLC